MAENIHGHRVLEMMVAAQEPFTKESLEKAIITKFGAEARFETCSAEGMTAMELIEFLAGRGKFFEQENGFTTTPDSICDHE